MQTKRLGNTDLELTRVGLGTWAIGGGDWKFGWGPQDDAQSIAAIHRAIDLGVNWIDTAPAYGLGHCEEIVGRALKGMSKRPIVATKCERCWNESRELFPCLRRDSVLAECDASLKRLGVDVIDLYQIHWPQPDEDIEEGWEAVQTLIKAGKIRYGGVSNFNASQLARIAPLGAIASLQPPYSLLARGVEESILPYCGQNNIGVVAYSPMQKGLLTGKVTAEWVAGLDAKDHRKFDPNFQSPKLEKNLAFVEQLKSIAAKQGKTAAQLSIAWVLARPEVTAAIVGARRPDQVDETIAAGDWVLTPDVLAEIEAAYPCDNS